MKSPALTPLTDFPVRPQMEVGESLVGFLCRFYGVNGHRLPHELYSALIILHRGIPEGIPTAFGMVQSMLGEVLDLDRFGWVDRQSAVHPNQKRQIWQNPKFNSPRFCPQCLLEKGFHFALWEQPLVMACPEHGCILFTACPKCSENFVWFYIRPLWRCRCGNPIMNIQPRLAEPRSQMVARAITRSSDANLPLQFRDVFRESTHGSYSLEEAYIAFTWGTRFRKYFLKQTWTQSEVIKYNRRPMRTHSDPSLWEYRLVTNSPEALVTRLLQVLQRRCKNRHFLNYFFLNDRLIKAQEFLINSESNVLQMKMMRTVHRFITGYQFTLSTSFFIWCSLELNSERRNRLMLDFLAWWRVLSSHMSELDPMIREKTAIVWEHGERYDGYQAERIVVKILNLLLDSAAKQVDPESFSALTHWWRIPSELRNISNPDEAFRQIGLHLLSVSRAEVLFVHVLLKADLRLNRA